MLKNFSTKAKLMTIPVVYLLIVIISACIYAYYSNIVSFRISASSQTEVFIQQVLKGRISAYQFLRTPSQQNAQNVVDNFILLNKEVSFLKSKLTNAENIETSKRILASSNLYIDYFNQFSSKRIDEYRGGIEKESKELKPIIAKMVNTGLDLENNLNKINKKAVELKVEAEKSLQYTLIAIAIISIILFVIFSTLLANIIVSTIEKFKLGLTSFFSYINREVDDTSLLEIEGKDEFAQMAKEINMNISNTKQGLIKDNETVNEVLSIVEKANQGYLDLEVKSQANNPQLVQLCDALNTMLLGIKVNVDSVNDVLTQYSNYKFTAKLDESKTKGDIATLIKSINFITDEISTLLKNSYVIGLTLDDASDQLIVNVDTLNRSSNEAAASLEETAAALEEITSTIVHNSENVQLMSTYADKLTKSAKLGQKQAQNTSNAMENITDQVNSISEAITVIDQIAFQTNILSLNAAVEAATAGEAGKGFAVVAQEVRNLAARSAEAAKEIKELVENATSKAAQGKEISSQMIMGYKELLIDINKSTEKISEITNASKEQEQGITQINDAVTHLDQQTQQNALIASQTHDIAVETDDIAKEIVKDAKSKDFLGKNDARARTKVRDSRILKTNSETPVKIEIKKTIISQKNNDEEWESF